ncbi:MAG: pyruvate formate lyase family protein [Kiritimatiellae bacterium]|nr:pyruvate formate lyase family protein [Kiritimatiellia bacterium]MDD5522129.1 pyruvate formate lyase family protein [Kiritimatiellia bacterium]
MNEKIQSKTELFRSGVEKVRTAKRAQECMDEWFEVQAIKMEQREAMLAEGLSPDSAEGQAELLCRIVRLMPLSIFGGSVLAGTQDGAFSASYALINPSFKVEEFAGYCDPTAIYNDIKPDPGKGITSERIATVRQYWAGTRYVQQLQKIYASTEDETKEVIYFAEPVTGHTIPGMRPYLKCGVKAMQKKARELKTGYGNAMAIALEAVIILAQRYMDLAKVMAEKTVDDDEKQRLLLIAGNLENVPEQGACTLHEAVQSFVLLWQVMALEQAPNPYAFSAGNLDRIFSPYYDPKKISRQEAVELIRHLLCFFQVGSRCWAISQNIIVGGKNECDEDMVDEMSYIVLDAFFATNDPQPALSVKVHKGTDETFYKAMGRFFFTSGHSTPSLFNDDVMFEMLKANGIALQDLPDYSIAGCQEPLVMGKSSLNTTNTWLNLGKIMELVCNDGISMITNRKIAPSWRELGYSGDEKTIYADLEDVFFKLLDYVLRKMQTAGNALTELLGQEKPVPFTSALMDSLYTGCDMRDPKKAGTRYNASGCLIHGLAVVTDSLYAMKCALDSGKWQAGQIRQALQGNFQGYESLQQFLVYQDKFGSNHDEVDAIAVRIAEKVSQRVSQLANPVGSPYLADFSTPSTHLLYGYWVGATPDGRKARTMLNYGVDPRAATTSAHLPDRFLSNWKLPFMKMTGGYASHIGISPDLARNVSGLEAKGLWMRDNIIKPLFRLGDKIRQAPYYVYFNIDSAIHLRKVLKDPKKYAPSGIYIMRIHGTFVNFLDLSPAIQEDIITRLEAGIALAS